MKTNITADNRKYLEYFITISLLIIVLHHCHSHPESAKTEIGFTAVAAERNSDALPLSSSSGEVEVGERTFGWLDARGLMQLRTCGSDTTSRTLRPLNEGLFAFA